MGNTSHPIILFDGVCPLCCSLVAFTLKRDRLEEFRFAPLQSDVGRAWLSKCHLLVDHLDTFVLIEADRCYIKSTAVLRVVKRLAGLWSLLYVFILIPRPIRDWIYDVVAQNRYRWFGHRDQCLTPTAELKHRFLE